MRALVGALKADVAFRPLILLTGSHLLEREAAGDGGVSKKADAG